MTLGGLFTPRVPMEERGSGRVAAALHHRREPR
jgi:hypothetical protein